MLSTQVVLSILSVAAFAYGAKAYSWQLSKNGLPGNAVFAGHDSGNYPLFVGRAKYNGKTVVANISPNYGTAFMSYNSKEVTTSEWEYLVGDCFFWTRSYDGYVPRNAVYNVNENGIKEYVGRKQFKGALTPGRINPQQNVLNLSLHGEVFNFDKYEVLVSCEYAL